MEISHCNRSYAAIGTETDRGYRQGRVRNSIEDPLSELQAASVRNRVAMGKRRGEWIRRIGSLGIGDPPEHNGPLCASVAQFSLHANVYCAPNQREKLEKICRYVARTAVAESRIKLKNNGDVLLRLKKPYSDGTSHLVFSPQWSFWRSWQPWCLRPGRT